MARTRQKPEYLLHAGTGQARVRINGRDHYLGKYGSAASRKKYRDLIRDWRAGLSPSAAKATRGTQAIDELVLDYLEHARTHYVKNGAPTSELGCIQLAIRHLVKLYGTSPVKDFGPKALGKVRQSMIDAGYTRKSINRHVSRLVRMFDWGVSEEIVPTSIAYRLSKLPTLKAGRCEAPEGERVRPVPEARVEAIRPHVSRPVWGAIQVQLLTAMRPGEVLAMRGCDLNMTGEQWEYRPATHKTEHHGHERIICIGPKAQAVLREFLTTDLQAPLFSPREGRQQYLSAFTGPGRRERKGTSTNQAREFYTPETYHRAIRRGCEKAFEMPDHLRKIDPTLPKASRDALRVLAAAWRKENCWHPHQLRHTAATKIRREAGIETARIVLGHSSAVTTELYAEADVLKAREIMARVG